MGAENQNAGSLCSALADVQGKTVKEGEHMQTTEAKRGQARRRVSLRKWIVRLNGWAVVWYALLTAAGVLLYKAGAAYAMRERGYYAIGGEALALLLPVLYYVTATTIRDIVRDMRNRR